MIDFKERHIPVVTHIGTLDWSAEDLRPGRDGPALAVSNRPDAWRNILRSNAPDVVLSCSNALWVDGFSIGPDGRGGLMRWGKMREYLDPCPVWCATWIDPDTGEFREATRGTRAEAQAAAGASGSVAEDEGARLRPRALARLGRWQDPFDWFGAILLLYTREVIVLKRPLICGVWWDEPVDLTAGIAPSGQLLPDAFARFEVDIGAAETVGFTEAYPGLVQIGAKPMELLWS